MMADDLEKRMDKLEDNMSHLQSVVTTHLVESGEIRTTLKACKDALDDMKNVPADNKWLKKLMWFVLGSPFLVELLRHVHLAGKP
jgi:hypothetical protein